MKINANMSAVMTNNQLLRTENKLSSAMEKLSSGLKLNSAEDNPAGMAISNKMKAQIDALDQAEDNATDGVSVLQIADGALSEVHSMLQRMRELSVQAANGTYSTSDRESLQDEIDQLSDEITRISEDTEYNTKTLLDGSSDVRTYAEHATRISVSDNVEPGNYSMTIEQAATQAMDSFSLNFDKNSGKSLADDPTTAAYFQAAGTTKFSLTINDTTINVDSGMTGAQLYKTVRDNLETAGAILTEETDSTDPSKIIETVATEKYGNEASIQFSTDNVDLAVSLFGFDKDAFHQSDETGVYEKDAVYGTDVQISLDTGADSKFTSTATATSKGNKVTVTDRDGFEMSFFLEEGYSAAEDGVDGSINFEVTDIGAMTIQLGANQYQTMDVRIPEVSASSLYLDQVDLVKDGGAEDAMDILDDAIATVSEVRSRIGACQNRLEYAESSLSETGENMTSAYSNITDTDMAEEMTEYTQQTVLDQAAISVLSQANEIPQQVLSLLG